MFTEPQVPGCGEDQVGPHSVLMSGTTREGLWAEFGDRDGHLLGKRAPAGWQASAKLPAQVVSDSGLSGYCRGACPV